MEEARGVLRCCSLGDGGRVLHVMLPLKWEAVQLYLLPCQLIGIGQANWRGRSAEAVQVKAQAGSGHAASRWHPDASGLRSQPT